MLLKKTSQSTPSDYQECLVYSECEGFQVATWKNLNGEAGFFLFGSYEKLHRDQAVLWSELPTQDEINQCL